MENKIFLNSIFNDALELINITWKKHNLRYNHDNTYELFQKIKLIVNINIKFLSTYKSYNNFGNMLNNQINMYIKQLKLKLHDKRFEGMI